MSTGGAAEEKPTPMINYFNFCGQMPGFCGQTQGGGGIKGRHPEQVDAPRGMERKRGCTEERAAGTRMGHHPTGKAQADK